MKSLSRFRFPLILLTLGTTACFAQRSLQISSILRDIGDATIEGFELTNFGTTAVDTSNWQFCLYSSNQKGGCDGAFDWQTTQIEPGDTILIQWLSKQFAYPREDANAITLFDLNDGNAPGTENMIDHMQWSTDGIHNESASVYSQQAVAAGLWTGETDWIDASPMISQIHLQDTTGGILHGPGDFMTQIIYPPSPCDFNHDYVCDIADLDIYLSSEWYGFLEEWLNQASWWNQQEYKEGDINLDGNVDSTDLGRLLNNFGREEDSLLYSEGNLALACCGNNKETVNSEDLGRLLNNFGHTSPEPANTSVAVPEPESGATLGLAALGILFINRRSGKAIK